jgi:hypothetical protein
MQIQVEKLLYGGLKQDCRRHKPMAHLLADEAGNGLSVGDADMYALIAVEEDDAALLEEIIRRGCDRCLLRR